MSALGGLMRFLKVTGLFAIVSMGVFLFYTLVGGNLHIMFQPFEMMMIVVIYWLAFTLAGIPATRFDLLKKLNRCCFIVSAVTVPTFGIVHTMGYLDLGATVIGEHIAAALVGVPLSAIAFLAVELTLLREEFVPQPDRIAKGLVGVSATAIVALVGIVCYGYWEDHFVLSKFEAVVAQESQERNKLLKEATARYYEEHCEPMPYAEQKRLECKIEQEQRRKPASAPTDPNDK